MEKTTKKINSAISTILKNGIVSKNFCDAMLYKTLSANNPEYRKYNGKLRTEINTFLDSAKSNVAIDIDIASVATLIFSLDKYFTLDSAKKRKIFIEKNLPEIKKICERVGYTITISEYSRNNDVGKVYPANGKGLTCYSFIVSNITSYIKFRIETKSDKFCLKENRFSCLVTE